LKLLQGDYPEFFERASNLIAAKKKCNCHGAIAYLLHFTDEIRVFGPRFILNKIHENGLVRTRKPVGKFIILPHNGSSPDHSGIGLNGIGLVLGQETFNASGIINNREKILVLHKTGPDLKISPLYGGYFGCYPDLDFYEIRK
jgi:hypothetical protein